MSKQKGKWLSSELFFQQVAAGTVDGVNVTFTLSHEPYDSKSLRLSLNGRRLQGGVDYSISGVTITMAVAPAFGQQLDAYYLKKT